MSLTDKLTAEKAGLESYLDSVRGAKLEQNQINRLLTINGLLGIGADGESSSDITSNSSIQYGAGVVDAKTQRIVIASNGNSVVFASPQAVTQSGSWDVTNISGTVSLPTGASTSALQTTGNASLTSIDTKLPASLGAKAPSASLSVTQAFAATSTLANVASSATSVSLLAANNNRKTAIIINDSTSDLYVTLNASAASTTNYSLFLAAKVGNTPSFLAINGDDYSGEIRGIWSSANGFARITEVV
jgi:hypothetical protein